MHVRTNPPKRHKIVFFGETGVGKSSIINMLLGSDQAEVSSDAEGCTAKCTSYRVRINEEEYELWDTIGLNEGEQGNIPDIKAASSLYHQLRKLSDTGGVNLLVFCMRGPRVTTAGHRNWLLFHDVICDGKVPAVIVVTHLELEDMDTWWSRNELVFARYNIVPSTEVYRLFPAGQQKRALFL
ncbi:hypothetical protein NMY22_g12121 [Coprinellus aureogranulatus]|nr:hypothetical protein NMY22_g12121 [Coprinellus aureogranulatus]